MAPLVVAFAIMVAPARLRSLLVYAGAAAVAAGSVALLVQERSADITFYALDTHLADRGIVGAEMVIAALLLGLAARFRKPLLVVPVLLQAGFTLAAEFGHHIIPAEYPLFCDSFSVIMALIIGVIGGLIAVHAVGYMADYQAHHEGKDHRRGFFAVFFLFLSAMFGLVFSNSLTWMFAFWEITTLCSFLLIAYPRTQEAINNAFTALIMNLVGGVGFAAAIYLLAASHIPLELNRLVGSGVTLLLPAVLICFAGLAKSAQLPFSSWLLGAMVAPTPISALLHSSTMVKAGVYVIIRLAPVVQGTFAGLMLAMVGCTTFVVASLLAVSQSNAKRVLAYSTIANLGLIVTCAAAGSAQAVWAAILLVIFHAVAKALLFLAVGTTEHQIASRDIEDMQGLIIRLPKLAFALLVGIAGMFLAPFGMLISKWAAMEALIVVNPLLPVMVCFGSSATLFFWGKWMGKLLAANQEMKPLPWNVSRNERIALGGLMILTIGMCGLFPVVSNELIDPYLYYVHHAVHSMGQGNLTIMALMLGLLAILPLSLLYRGGAHTRRATPYLAGANIAGSGRFTGSMGQTHSAGLRNYYLAELFGEARIQPIGLWLSALFIVALLVTGGL